MIQEWSKWSLALVAQNAGLNFPKMSISTIGLHLKKYSAWLAVRLLTGNSFLQPQMKMFTMDVEIHMRINLIRCAGGLIVLRTTVFFCSSKSPFSQPWLFFSSERISNLQCNPYYPAILVFRLFFSRLVTTFSTYPGNSQTVLVFLQQWAVITFMFCRELLIQQVTFIRSLNLTLSQL